MATISSTSSELQLPVELWWKIFEAVGMKNKNAVRLISRYWSDVYCARVRRIRISVTKEKPIPSGSLKHAFFPRLLSLSLFNACREPTESLVAEMVSMVTRHEHVTDLTYSTNDTKSQLFDAFDKGLWNPCNILSFRISAAIIQNSILNKMIHLKNLHISLQGKKATMNNMLQTYTPPKTLCSLTLSSLKSIDGETLVTMVNKCPYLTELHASCYHPNSARTLRELSRLQVLDIGRPLYPILPINNYMEDTSSTHVIAIPKLPDFVEQLQYLPHTHLIMNYSWQLEAFPMSKSKKPTADESNMPNLVSYEAVDGRPYAKFDTLTRLTHLGLIRTGLSNVNLAFLVNVTSLKLDEGKISERTISHYPPNLKSLWINTPYMAIYFGRFIKRTWPNITSLRITISKSKYRQIIGKEEISWFVQSCPKLETIIIEGNVKVIKRYIKKAKTALTKLKAFEVRAGAQLVRMKYTRRKDRFCIQKKKI
mmetsp:Transcript_16206/g.18037  ORF Transcript_16206/g.18037 Transcript_16206/m.18037 type:complete len:481 (+) Transcript_16206:177-1619(+)